MVSEVPTHTSEQPNEGPPDYVKTVHLYVQNPKGTFHDFDVAYDGGAEPDPGSWHWPMECPDGL